MNSLIYIVFTSVLLSQVTCNPLGKITSPIEARNNEVRSTTYLYTYVYTIRSYTSNYPKLSVQGIESSPQLGKGGKWDTFAWRN